MNVSALKAFVQNAERLWTGLEQPEKLDDTPACPTKTQLLKRCALALMTGGMLAILSLSGCDSPKLKKIDLSERLADADLQKVVPGHDADHLHFGFDHRGDRDEDVRQYRSFLEYLERATGLQFELHFTPGNRDIADQLGAGEIQFAAIGGFNYIRARSRYQVVPLVRGLNADGRADYQSVIVAAPDSPIRKIGDLQGKRFAFGSTTSTQGHLIPRIQLYRYDILLDDLAAHAFTGSHQGCVNEVLARRYEACAMQDVLGQRLAQEGRVRIIDTSGFFPSSGIAANKDVPAAVMEKVKKALLEFEPMGAHAATVYHWDRTEMANGFIEARDADYATLREWALRLDMMIAGDEEKPSSG